MKGRVSDWRSVVIWRKPWVASSLPRVISARARPSPSRSRRPPAELCDARCAAPCCLGMKPRFSKRRQRPLLAAVVVALALGACSDSMAPAPADAIVGLWSRARAPTDPPGSSSSMTLQRTGATITGSGGFVGEAGPLGANRVTRSVDGQHGLLSLTYTY